MIVRELLTLLGYKTDQASKKKAEAGFGDVKRQALAVSAAVAAIGVTAAVVFSRLVGEVAAAGDEIAKSSKQIGINAQRLQELRLAANLAGASNTELGTGLRLLTKNADDAAKGTGEFADDFKRLGVDVRDSTGRLKSADRLLLEVSDGMRGLSGDSERAALAQSLLGRSGIKLVPLLNQGSEAIRAQAARANELGEVFDARLLADSERLTDAQRELSGAFTGVKATIARVLMPSAIRMIDWLTDMVVLLRGPVSRGLDALSTVFGAVGRALVLLVTLADDFMSAITGITGALKKYAAVAVVAWMVATAPILLTIALLGLIAFAIVAVVEDLEKLGRGEGFFAGIITEFQTLLAEIGLVNAALEMLKTAFDFWTPDLFTDIAGLFGLKVATPEQRKVARELTASAEGRASAAPTAFAYGSSGAATNITNRIETTVNAPAGMDAKQLASETAAKTGTGTDYLMRKTLAQTAVVGG